MTNQTPTDSPVIACDMTAIDEAHREQHGITIRELFSAVQDVEALPTGYAFRLPADMLLKSAEFIAYERLCCPFFNFALEVTPDHGPVWLRLTGSAEIKPLIREGFLSMINEKLAYKLNL